MTDYSKVNWSEAAQVALTELNDTKEKRSSKKFEKKEVDLTKYFSINLGKTEKSGTKIFRMLPDQEDPRKFAKEVYFHYIQVGKDWKKLYDPAQNNPQSDKESPLNDARKALNAHPDKEVKKQAMKYRPRLFYIIRGIERGKEHEGVKFWRFPSAHDGKGIMDKIESLISIYNNQAPGAGAFWNPIAGRDLIISTGKDETRGFTAVTNMIVSDVKALSDDQDQANAWLSDPTVWSDVYKTNTPIEYLRLVAEGSVPVWDKDQNKYVAKTDDDVTTAQAPAQAMAEVTAVPSADAVTEANESSVRLGLDDLPF